MELIVDTNSIISALLKDSATRKVLFLSNFKFYAPEEILSELFALKTEIAKRAGYSQMEADVFWHYITSLFGIVPKETYENFVKDASKLISDEQDIPFIALALAIPNDGIWTADRHFEEQTRIKVWKTPELLKRM